MTDTDILLEDPSTSHRVYIGDSIGCLRVAQCAASSSVPDKYEGPSISTVLLPGFKSHSDHAVQRIARGTIGSTYIVALARRNATIDVICVTNQSLPSSSASTVAPISDLDATILCTIKEPHMKAGIHRWIGLAVGSSGVHSCCSSGVYRFTPITISATGDAEVGEAKVIDTLPSPLQHVSFYPASDPTHFCYGGEDIPLSLWEISVALSEPVAADFADEESYKSIQDDNLNSKQRKRKRQLEAKSKARELLWGEVWRAKNLPNDNLSLPRRANITSTCILQLSADNTEEDRPVGEQSYIAAGTKDGLVRIFEPGVAARKHVREIRVVPAGHGAVKTLCASSSVTNSKQGGTLYVGDTGSKVYAVDWQTGKLLYGYKSAILVGATLSMTALPPAHPAKGSKQGSAREDLVTVSSDSLVRLLSTVPAAKAVAKPGSSPEKGEVVWSKILPSPTQSTIMPTPTAVVWDGVLPTAVNTKRSIDAEDDEFSQDDQEDDDEEDEVWDRLQAVSGKDTPPASESEDDDDDDDVAQTNRTSSKRKNGPPKKSRT